MARPVGTEYIPAALFKLFLEGLYHELIHEPEQEEVLADILNWLERQV